MDEASQLPRSSYKTRIPACPDLERRVPFAKMRKVTYRHSELERRQTTMPSV